MEKEKELLEKLSKEGNNFAIVDIEGDRLIGNCSLMDINHINRTAELGIFIRDKDYWSKGFGREAINLLLDYGFNLLNLNNILLKVYSFNKKGNKLL